ncbi:MAG: hypothetical protein ACYDBH_07085 [Acidobacteriaceae bacterium]
METIQTYRLVQHKPLVNLFRFTGIAGCDPVLEITELWALMYDYDVSWKRIIGSIVTVMISVMVGALIYEAFDIHDTKPFWIDPEFLLMMLSSMLILCFGIAALVRRLFSLDLSLSDLLPLGLLGLSQSSAHEQEAFERERLLFSPPLSVTALRI